MPQVIGVFDYLKKKKKVKRSGKKGNITDRQWADANVGSQSTGDQNAGGCPLTTCG